MNNNFLHMNPNGSVTLCARKRGCCPVMEQLPDGRVKITDDDGNSVVMKTEQASLISQGAELLENNGERKKQLLCD